MSVSICTVFKSEGFKYSGGHKDFTETHVMFRSIKKKNLALYVMIIPSVILALLFYYMPMIGLKIAFENFTPAKGLFGHQNFIGLANFKYILAMPNYFFFAV